MSDERWELEQRRLQAQLDEGVPKEEGLQLGYALFDEGMEHFSCARYPESLKDFEQSLAINERFMAPEALELCTNLNNCASAHEKLGQREMAVYFYERAVAVLNHPSAVYDEQRRRARDHVMGKLGRMTRGDAADDAGGNAQATQLVAAALWEEGLKLFKLDRPAEALVLFEHVLTYNHKFPPPSDSAVLATTLNNIGAAHEKCHNLGEAVSYFKVAADELRRSTVPGKEAKIAHVVKRLAQLQLKMDSGSDGGADSVVANASGNGRGDGHAGGSDVQPPPPPPPPPPPSGSLPSEPGGGDGQPGGSDVQPPPPPPPPSGSLPSEPGGGGGDDGHAGGSGVQQQPSPPPPSPSGSLGIVTIPPRPTQLPQRTPRATVALRQRAPSGDQPAPVAAPVAPAPVAAAAASAPPGASTTGVSVRARPARAPPPPELESPPTSPLTNDREIAD